jgi:hypothetical protein
MNTPHAHYWVISTFVKNHHYDGECKICGAKKKFPEEVYPFWRTEKKKRYGRSIGYDKEIEALESSLYGGNGEKEASPQESYTSGCSKENKGKEENRSSAKAAV